MTAPAPRIRWEPNEDGSTVTAAFRGYAGSSGAALFSIYAPNGRVPEWVLRSDLPGQERCRVESDSPDQLKHHGERLLEVFAASIGLSFPAGADDDEPVPYRMALTEITVRVARTGDRTADIVVTVPSGDEYLSPVWLVVGSCYRVSPDEGPEKWTAYLWPVAGGSMRVTQSCKTVDRSTLEALGKALIRRLVKEGAWWT